MTIKDYFIVKFGKHPVCLNIQNKDHKWITVYKNHTEGTVEIDGTAYLISDKKYYFKKGVPTYLYRQGDPEPIDAHLDLKVSTTNGEWEIVAPRMSAEDFSTAIKSHVVRDLFNTFNKKMAVETVVLLATVVIVAIIGGAAYFLMERINDLGIQIAQLQEMMRAIAGGVSD